MWGISGYQNSAQWFKLRAIRGLKEKMEETKIMNKAEKIGSAFWDYNFSTDELLALSRGERDRVGPLDREKLFMRMVSYLSWYDFIEIVGLQSMRDVMDESFLEKVKDPVLRNGLSYVIRVLRQETVSTAG